jgi:hypothetical protein
MGYLLRARIRKHCRTGAAQTHRGKCRDEKGEALPEKTDAQENRAARLKDRAAPRLHLCFYELRKSAAMER